MNKMTLDMATTIAFVIALILPCIVITKRGIEIMKYTLSQTGEESEIESHKGFAMVTFGVVAVYFCVHFIAPIVLTHLQNN